MHPDIASELSKVPFAPIKITHDTPQATELEAAAEIIHADACLLYDQLRKTNHNTHSVNTLINATRGLLNLRRKFLNLENDTESTPTKPKVYSIG